MTVRVDGRPAYEPDALVSCGESIPHDAVEVPAPVIVAEVLSTILHSSHVLRHPGLTSPRLRPEPRRERRRH